MVTTSVGSLVLLLWLSDRFPSIGVRRYGARMPTWPAVTDSPIRIRSGRR